MIGFPLITLWIAFAPVGFGLAACTQPAHAQFPQAMMALAPSAAGLEASGVAQVVNALETKPRLPVIWLHLQECTCCTESFIRAAHPIVATLLLDKISLDYTETLMAAAGEQAEAAKEETMKKYKGEYLLMIEGSIPTKDEGYRFRRRSSPRRGRRRSWHGGSRCRARGVNRTSADVPTRRVAAYARMSTYR